MNFTWQNLQILCEDGPVLAVNKPNGLISQGAPAGVESLTELVKEYIRHKYDKPGNVYLGIVHRLDRPVSGVCVFSRNSKCAARLSEQFRDRLVQKTYIALVEGHPPKEGKLTDWLLRTEQDDNVQIVNEGTKDARPSSLSYQVITRVNNSSVVNVQLETGRMHQIRVQFSSRGWPILGDTRYGAKQPLGQPPKNDPRLAAIALHAYQLKIKHPVRYDDLTIRADLPSSWKKLGIDEASLVNYMEQFD